LEFYATAAAASSGFITDVLIITAVVAVVFKIKIHDNRKATRNAWRYEVSKYNTLEYCKGNLIKRIKVEQCKVEC